METSKGRLHAITRGEMQHLDVIRFQRRDKTGSNAVSRFTLFFAKQIVRVYIFISII